MASELPNGRPSSASTDEKNIYVTRQRSSWTSWLQGRPSFSGRQNSMVFRMADVIREGYLLKQGLRFKLWSKRYFILRLEETHMTLSYYNSKEDLTLCQEIAIGPGYVFIDRAEQKHPFRFELKCSAKSIVLEAHSQEDYIGWKSCLKEAVRWNHAMVPQGERVVTHGEQVDGQTASQASASKPPAENGTQAAKADAPRKTSEASDKPQKPAPKDKPSKDEKSKAKLLPCNREGHHAFMTNNAKFELPLRYKYQKTLGSGAYGVVVAATDSECDKQVAIKNIQKAFDDLTDAKRIVREIKLMRHLDHKNVLGVLDIIEPASLEEFEDVYIVSELMATDLHRVIYSRHALSDEHIAYFMYQMLCALKYIHSAGVIHRDLKPSNILLNSNCELKICDFGLARGVAPEENMELTEYVVTRWYRAPEIMLGCMKYTAAVDVWSLGCMFAEMLGRKPLFPGQDYIDQLHLIMNILGAPSDEELHFLTNARARKFMNAEWHKRRGQPVKHLKDTFKDANPQAIDLMEKMLVIDPSRRLSVDEALIHPYLASVRSAVDETVCPNVWDFDFEQADLNKFALQCLIWSEMLFFHPQALGDNMAKLPPESKKAAEKSLKARAEFDAQKASQSKSDSLPDHKEEELPGGNPPMRLRTETSADVSE